MIYDTHCSQHTYYFNIFNCSSSDCLYYINLLGELIQTFPDPITYTKPTGVESYKVGKDSTKRKASVLFSPQFTVSNVRTFLCCINCCQPILLYPQRKVLASSELNPLKHWNVHWMLFSLYVQHLYKKRFWTITPQYKKVWVKSLLGKIDHAWKLQCA